MLHNFKIIFCGLALCLTLLPLPLLAATTNFIPAIQAVTNIQVAIDTANPELFHQHVQVNSLLDQAIQILQTKAVDKADVLPPVLAIMVLSLQNPQMADSIKAMLKTEVVNFLNYQIVSGNFAGKPTQQKPPKSALAPLLGDISTGRKELKITGTPRKEEEKIIVPTTLHDFGNDKDYKLDLSLQLIDNIWQVVKIENIKDLTKKLQKEATT